MFFLQAQKRVADELDRAYLVRCSGHTLGSSRLSAPCSRVSLPLPAGRRKEKKLYRRNSRFRLRSHVIGEDTKIYSTYSIGFEPLREYWLNIQAIVSGLDGTLSDVTDYADRVLEANYSRDVFVVRTNVSAPWQPPFSQLLLKFPTF